MLRTVAQYNSELHIEYDICNVLLNTTQLAYTNF